MLLAADVPEHRHPVNVALHDRATVGQRVADRMASAIGSWRFLIAQSAIFALWVAYNGWLVWRWTHHQPFDPFPFLLLNIVLSFQAAYTGPILLIAANRQGQKDRLTLEHSAAEAEKAEQQTTTLLEKIDANTEATLQILQHTKELIARP